MLAVLYEGPGYVAIEKPAGLLVHPTELAAHEQESCMTQLRDQLGRWVYPVHRLDRATSGVLLFAFDSQSAEQLSALYRDKKVRKTYIGAVRGFTAEEAVIDRPLRKNFAHKGSPHVEARTTYRRLSVAEHPYPVGRYATARYSLLEIIAETGRLHQIRRHMSLVNHHMLGDTVHGDGKHNRLIREKFGIHRLLLHAASIEFVCPWSRECVSISSKLNWNFIKLVGPIFPDYKT